MGMDFSVNIVVNKKNITIEIGKLKLEERKIV